MKGMMVTLLMLGLTGTVNAQQFGKDDSLFGASNPARTAPNQNDFLNSSGRDGSVSSSRQLLQLALPFSPEVIQNLRRNGQESAQIDRPAETGEVIFGFEKPLEEAKNSPNYQNVKPVAVENGALVFEFTDSDLKAVETSTLRYRFAPQEVGQYDSIIVRIRGAKMQNDPYQIPSDNDQFAGIRGQQGIQPPDENSEWDTRRNPVNDDSFGQGNTFRGTANSTIPDRSIPSSAPNRFAFNDKSSTPDLAAFTPDREPQTDAWKTDSRSPTTDLAPSFEATQRRAEFLANLQDSREKELRIRELQLEEKARSVLAEQQRLQRLNGFSSDSTWNTGSAASTNAMHSPNGNRFASNTLGMRPVDDSQSTGIQSGADPNLQNLASMVSDGFNSLKQSHLDLSSRIQSIESQQRYSDAMSQTVAGQSPTTGSGLPDRLSRPFTPAMSGYQAQIPGTERNLAINQNMTGPIYFMLICSLGLNIYLGLISRNFYVRYNELADELRETFSASISN